MYIQRIMHLLHNFRDFQSMVAIYRRTILYTGAHSDYNSATLYR